MGVKGLAGDRFKARDQVGKFAVQIQQECKGPGQIVHGRRAGLGIGQVGQLPDAFDDPVQIQAQLNDHKVGARAKRRVTDIEQKFPIAVVDLGLAMGGAQDVGGNRTVGIF